jgi:hypothetical protein
VATRSRTGWIVAAAVLGAGGVALALFGVLWGLFFSVGARGGSTEEMVRYNLADPLLALIAYGPLALGLVAVLAAGVLLVIGLTKR